MDIHLSSLKLQHDTKKTVLFLLENERKPSFIAEKIKNFFAKKSTIYYCLFAVFFMALPSETTFTAETEQKTFIATAYYSPLPNQTKYYRWSYEADKKLNGWWIKGSDGTPVFVGMIAAPKNYAFGTKIELDGLGVVSVHDRGWAIVSSADGVTYDRIDIWMGYGDEGLERTLAWGRREITGKIVDSNTAVSLDLQNIVKNAPQITQTALQKFQAIGYELNWRTFAELVLQFQLDHKIINSSSEAGAGNYWPKTTAKLNQLYNEKIKNSSSVVSESKNNTKLENIVTFEETKTNLTEKEAMELSQNMAITYFGEYSETVKNLQKFLQKTGYFKENVDWIMTLQTLYAIRKYQSDRWLIQTWRIDIPTQVFIRQDLLK